MDSCVAIGHFAVRKEVVKHREYSALEGFADGCDFPSVHFEKLGMLPLFPPKSLAELYTFVYDWSPREGAGRYEDALDLWSLFFKADKEKLTNRTRTEGLQGKPQRKSYNLTIWKTMVIRCGQEREDLPWMSSWDG